MGKGWFFTNTHVATLHSANWQFYKSIIYKNVQNIERSYKNPQNIFQRKCSSKQLEISSTFIINNKQTNKLPKSQLETQMNPLKFCNRFNDTF